ncbi:hypothetical protein [Nannocystis pusilla]|uniref:Uncharacterized protein n=1 Tax=Nannocystis pusilla TaxID=889268 RepID=A0ABS7TUR6_9BACT|nr:hypothetical protein [Nannocystis pusilla]MBZ5711963.1 hypothetical protein [Nannocystis pusilla]
MSLEPDHERALREAEVDNADAAAEEMSLQGFTHRRCSRCNGELNVNDRGSGYTVSCETEKCLRLTFRGI